MVQLDGLRLQESEQMVRRAGWMGAFETEAAAVCSTQGPTRICSIRPRRCAEEAGTYRSSEIDHMEFRIADTFTDSLARLTGEEQKAAKMAAFDLQLNPAHPGLQLHKLDKAKDPNFCSIRVTRDIRLIVHRTGTSLLLCYVASSRRCLPVGGAATAGDASEDRRSTTGRDS